MTSETRLTVLPTMIQVDGNCCWPSMTRSTCSDNATSKECDYATSFAIHVYGATSTANQIAECHCAHVQIHAINVSKNWTAKESTEGKHLKH